MPWVVQLVDATSSVDLNDTSTFFLNVGGFQSPPPPERLSYGGENLARHGADLLARRYANRNILVGFQIKGTDATALGSAIGTVWEMLRKAEEFSVSGLGTQVQLKYQWEGAPSPVYFNILRGALDLGGQLHSPYLLKGTRIRNAALELTCEPFAVGTAETVENFLKDPSFEIAGSALADWTVTAGTGTVTRQTGTGTGTAGAKYGTAWGRVVRTGGTAENNAYQETTTLGSGTTVSVAVWRRLLAATSGMSGQLRIESYNSGGTLLSTSTANFTATGTVFTQTTITAFVTEATAATLRIIGALRSGTGTGTVEFDGFYLGTGTAIPTAWVSGRDVANHFDDNGQAHINYLDIYGVPGDVPAALQVKARENEAHTDFWVGARHAGRQRDASIFLEAENFTGSVIAWNKVALVSASNGSIATGSGTVTNPAAPATATLNISSPPSGLFRILVRAQNLGAGTTFIGMGYAYGSLIQTPGATSDYTAFAQATFQIKDLGNVTIPPVDIPPGGTTGTFQLRLAWYGSGASDTPSVDWVMLVPVENGFAYANKASAQDVVWADSRAIIQAIYLMNTSDVMQSIPANQVGQPPEAHPKGTRLYFLSDDGTADIDDGFKMAITYVPRFLQVA